MVISTRMTRFNSTDTDFSAFDEEILSPSPSKRARTRGDSDGDSSGSDDSSLQTSIAISSKSSSSILYSPYLTLGQITTSVTPVVLTQSTQSIITLPLLHSYQTLSITHSLRTLIVSKPLPTTYGEITSLQSTSKITTTGTQFGYLTFHKRTSPFKTFKLQGSINTILAFDTLFVVHSDVEGKEEESVIGVYEVQNVSSSFPSVKLLNTFNVLKSSGIIHPTSYINKILTYGPNTCLYNIRTEKQIHNFNLKTKQIYNTPALDTCAIIPTSSPSSVTLYNLKLSKKIFTLNNNSPVKSLTFRTDGLCTTMSPMICVTGEGLVTWDLRSKQILCKDTTDVNSGNCIISLKNEPLSILTVNNGVKVLAYDVDFKGRLLRERLGHSQPINFIKYLNHNSKTEAKGDTVDDCNIFTGSREIRIFNTGRSALDCEWSQGAGLIKKAKEIGLSKQDLLLPSIIDFGYDMTKKVGVSIHENTAFAYVWSKDDRSQNGPVLRQDNWKVGNMQVKPDTVFNASSVSMSACGEFAIVGTIGGGIFKYNVESGEGRGSWPKDYTETVAESRNKLASRIVGSVKRTMKEVIGDDRLTTGDKIKRERMEKAKEEDKEDRRLRSLERRHYDMVIGCWVASSNLKMYSIDESGKVLGWSFKTRLAESRTPKSVGATIVKATFNYDSDMIAYGIEGGGVGVWECKGAKVVRRMRGGGEVNDICWGGDGRRVFCSSLDGSIRVYDVPTGQCVDWMTFKSPPTSLTVSTTGEFLATSHADSKGISLWADKSFYQTVHLTGPPAVSTLMDDPSPGGGEEEDEEQEINESPAKTHSDVVGKAKLDDDADEEEDGGPVVPKGVGMVTLSGLPDGHWKNLFHLELVKLRNKPKEAPKKPESAPFFLQRRGDGGTGLDMIVDEKVEEVPKEKKLEGWDDAWSDDDEEGDGGDGGEGMEVEDTNSLPQFQSRLLNSFAKKGEGEEGGEELSEERRPPPNQLAALLRRCDDENCSPLKIVTEYLQSMGPSAIDVAMTTLCSGEHDSEGIDFLVLFVEYLGTAAETRENFEAFNAYLNRFLFVHADLLRAAEQGGGGAGGERRMAQMKRMKEAMEKLKESQAGAANRLKEKLTKASALVKHFQSLI